MNKTEMTPIAANRKNVEEMPTPATNEGKREAEVPLQGLEGAVDHARVVAEEQAAEGGYDGDEAEAAGGGPGVSGGRFGEPTALGGGPWDIEKPSFLVVYRRRRAGPHRATLESSKIGRTCHTPPPLCSGINL